jgi:hypothetical protein
MFSGGNIHYEMAERVRAVGFGGIGASHTMAQELGPDQAINDALHLLKIHAPYFESDHVLNLSCNILTEGECVEDIERLRENEAYMEWKLCRTARGRAWSGRRNMKSRSKSERARRM